MTTPSQPGSTPDRATAQTATPRATSTRIAGFAAALLLAALAAPAQSESTFQESERITAIDLLIDVYPKIFEGTIDPAWSRTPAELAPEAFEIQDRGRARRPIAVAPPADAPWRIVVYVDQHLSSTASIRRGASLLAQFAARLTDLGTVEMVTATPRLRQSLAATTDPELVDSTLSNLAIRGAGDDRLRTLRAEYLETRRDPDLALTTAELADAYAAEETRLVQNGFDDLLLRLLDAGTPSDRKALFLVTDGFDLDLGRFYADAPEARGEALATSYRDFLGAVAAYGWVVVPVLRPLVYDYPESIGAARALVMKIDRNRNPERAEALLELGRTQLEDDDWAAAEATFEKAIHRFYDHPKTRTRQAVAETLLAEALTGQRRHEEAELALRRAVALDPALGPDHIRATAALLEPDVALVELADACAGDVVGDEAELGDALDSLERRFRVTYQVTGAPDGQLHPVTVDLSRFGYGARTAAWARSSTPPAVAAARARQRLRSYDSRHDDTLAARLERAGSEIRAVVEIPDIESELPVGPFRLTLALDGEEMLPTVDHRILAAEATSGTITVPRPVEAAWAALLLEDLGTGVRHELLAPVP